jgi:hypothetical protein
MRATPLRPYRLTARNTAASAENKIHDETVARQLGFRGGLVPGVTVYAYATHPLVAAVGPEWLERGTAEVRFVGPVLDQEEVTVSGALADRDGGGVTATLSVTTRAGGECATATATLPPEAPAGVDVGAYPRAPLPGERPLASPELLMPGRVLGTPEVVYDETFAAGFLADAADPLPLYRGPGAPVHPAIYLHLGNRALDRNVGVGPWIHVGSEVRHLGGARVGERLEVRGRVASAWTKRGRDYVALDLLIVAGPAARPAALLRHTAIWRLPAGG